MHPFALNVDADEVSCRAGTIKCSRCIASLAPIRIAEFGSPAGRIQARQLSRQTTNATIRHSPRKSSPMPTKVVHLRNSRCQEALSCFLFCYDCVRPFGAGFNLPTQMCEISSHGRCFFVATLSLEFTKDLPGCPHLVGGTREAGKSEAVAADQLWMTSWMFSGRFCATFVTTFP
jgi:hypothetical protein